MNKLVSLAEAKAALGASGSSTSVDATLTRLLEEITFQLETILRTEFEQAERVDRFFIDQTLWERGMRDRQIPLLLRAGFLDMGTPPVVRSYASVADLQLSGEVVPQPYPAEVLAEEGNIRLYLTDDLVALNNVVEVTYTAGFTVTDEVYDNVPDWLRSLAIAMLRESYVADCDDASCGETAYSLRSMIEPRIRWEPLYAKAHKVS